MAERGKKKAKVEDPTGGNINQVRDILIGPFQREQEARLKTLERTLERYKKDTVTAAERLESKLQKKMDEAAKSSKSADKDLQSSLDEARAEFAAEIEALEKQTVDHLNTLRSDVELELARLRDEKTGREDLGDYLMELGLRLKGESSLEKIETTVARTRGGDAKA